MRVLFSTIIGVALCQLAFAGEVNKPWSVLLADKNLIFDFPTVHLGNGQTLPLSKFCRVDAYTLKTSGVAYCKKTVVEKVACQDGGAEFSMTCSPVVEGKPIHGIVYEKPKCVEVGKKEINVPVHSTQTVCEKSSTIGGPEGDFQTVCTKHGVINVVIPLELDVTIYHNTAKGKDGIPGSTWMGHKHFVVPDCK